MNVRLKVIIINNDNNINKNKQRIFYFIFNQDELFEWMNFI